MRLGYTAGGVRRALEALPGQTILEALRAAGVTAVSAPCGGAGSCGKCRVRVGGLGWVLACQTPARPGMELFLPEQGAAAILREGALRLWEQLPPQPWPELGLGATAKAALGAAVDLGTTTLVVHLHDLVTGRRLGSAAEANAQAPFGADVVRRLAACEGDGLKTLAGAVRQQLSRMTRQLLCQAGAPQTALRAVCVAGNTIMLHILAGLSPASMGASPFEPLSRFGCGTPDGCGVPAWDAARVWLCPCVAGYFGGDITAGLLACGLGETAPGRAEADGRDKAPRGWRLFLDIGTNGEMALAGPGGILCCATAAGPAFEGAGILCGMAGADGAVSGVRWGPGGPMLTVLGGGPAKGICGSGLIEALAALRAVGALEPSGRLLSGEEAERAELEELTDWLGEERGENTVYLTADRRVFLTQGDIRRLQLAKAAIAAGANTLLHAAGIGCEQVEQACLAGGFGSSLSPKAACATGLLPQALAGKTLAVGNAAGEGAALALLRADARGRMRTLAGQCRYLELAADPFFAREYLEQMRF